MTTDILSNATSAIVTSGGTDAPAQGTSESWTVTTLSNFPVLTTGQVLRVMDQQDLGKTTGYEIMEVTANSNGTGVTWTVTRGVENTIPYNHIPGFTVFPIVSAGGLDGRYAQINSPTLTGSPKTVTPGTGDNTTNIPTTSWVNTAISNSFVSPAFTGVPTVPNAPSGTNTSQIASTSYVETALYFLSYLTKPWGTVYVNNQTGAYSPVIGDVGCLVVINSASPVNITLNSGIFSVGNKLTVAQYGVGALTIVGNGVQIDSYESQVTTLGQYAKVEIVFLSGTEALVSGDLW